MRTASLSFLVGVLIASRAALAVGGDDPITKDRKIYEGTWRVVSLEVDGKKIPENDARKLTVVNQKDGTWSLRSEGKEISSGGSDIDPTHKPKTIDFMPTLGVLSGNEYVGIYELGKDTRKMCFAKKDKGRPTEFEAPAGSERMLVIFERVKK